MGFSVSGATALLLVAFLIAFGAFYSATTGAVDQVQDAQVDQQDRNIEALNTEFEIDVAEYDDTEEELTIRANNTGATVIDTRELSLLVDGELTTFDEDDVELENPDGNEIWIEQQTLVLTIDDSDLADTPEDGETVKLVTDTGIADTATIEVVS